MNKSIKVVLIAAAVTGTMTAGIAIADSQSDAPSCGRGQHAMGSGRHHGDHESRIERMADVLGLTKDQRDAVRAIVDKSRPQQRALRDTLRENRKQLHAQMQQGTPSASEMRKVADAQGRAIADMIVLRTKTQADINAILTQEQREQFLEMRKSHWDKKSLRHRGRSGDAPEAASFKFGDARNKINSM
jgi:Spy/CpxP family protein refolding chaperone